MILVLFNFQTRFWHTDQFTTGAEGFALFCFGLVIAALAAGALYLSYIMISKWVLKCRPLNDELEIMEEQLRVGQQINRESLETFHQTLERFRVAEERFHQAEQPPMEMKTFKGEAKVEIEEPEIETQKPNTPKGSPTCGSE